MRRGTRLLAGIHDFVDTSYLKNRRPRVPGGAWPLDILRTKSMADLQQIWFVLVKERNMLTTMKEHYTRHTEELGAWPAPSRLTMVEDSMKHVKRVIRERDFLATDKAIAIFRERVQKGVYRYPPGPPLPPGHGATTSSVCVITARRPNEDRLREIFGHPEVFETHKGIVRIELTLPDEVLKQKEAAEKAFDEWRWAKSDYDQYQRYGTAESSSCDRYQEVELAPGEFLEEVIVAAKVPVPLRKEAPAPDPDPLKRLQYESRQFHEKLPQQLGYYPNLTSPAPPPPGDRPVHPDEIEGPWHATILFDSRQHAEFAASLGVQRIDGIDVLEVKPLPFDATPSMLREPIYREVLEENDADKEFMRTWPHIQKWSDKYLSWSKKTTSKIIEYNWSNSIDYVEREALLTQKSVWESPIKVDPTCGAGIGIPPGAEVPPPPLVPLEKDVLL